MIYLILAAIVWGSSFPVITYALGDISPFLFLVLRFSLAFIILLPRYRRLERFKTLFSRDLILISIPNSLAFIMQYKAQELTSASKTALFINSSPVYVVLISAVLLHEKFSPRQLVAMVITLTGVIITSTGLDFSDLTAINRGDLLCLGVGLSWAIFIMFSRGMAKKHGAYNMSQALYFWGVVMALPMLGTEELRFAWSTIPAVVYLAVITTILAFFLYLKGVQSVSALSTSIIILVEIVVAFLISHFFLGESFSVIETGGVLLVLIGVTMVLKR